VRRPRARLLSRAFPLAGLGEEALASPLPVATLVPRGTVACKGLTTLKKSIGVKSPREPPLYSPRAPEVRLVCMSAVPFGASPKVSRTTTNACVSAIPSSVVLNPSIVKAGLKGSYHLQAQQMGKKSASGPASATFELRLQVEVPVSELPVRQDQSKSLALSPPVRLSCQWHGSCSASADSDSARRSRTPSHWHWHWQ
jgi:hypothetical protein